MSDESSPDEPIPPDVTAAADHLPLPLVPPDVSRRLRETYHSSRDVVEAELVSDTRDSRALAGARGAGMTAWSMSYRAGPCDMVLDLTPERTALRLSGQLLCPEPTGDDVLRVFDGDSLVASTSPDGFGEFEVGLLPAAPYTITVTHAEHVIEMIVDLSERPAT